MIKKRNIFSIILSEQATAILNRMDLISKNKHVNKGRNLSNFINTLVIEKFYNISLSKEEISATDELDAFIIRSEIINIQTKIKQMEREWDIKQGELNRLNAKINKNNNEQKILNNT